METEATAPTPGNGGAVIDVPVLTDKQQKKVIEREEECEREEIFSDQIAMKLARGLAKDEWVKLAYALGFLPQAVAYFTGRASSAQNQYSQGLMMLKCWRSNIKPDELQVRLCDALQRIRRIDLAVKVGEEMEGHDTTSQNMDDEDIEDLAQYLKRAGNLNSVMFVDGLQKKDVLSNKAINLLARQLLAREEWKWMAYALGFLPEEVAQIVASASSSQNLYAQARTMLRQWRDRTPSYELAEQLNQAFVRIRRHDLVFMQGVGVLTTWPGAKKKNTQEKLNKMHKKVLKKAAKQKKESKKSPAAVACC